MAWVLLSGAAGCSQPAVDLLRPRDPSLVWPRPPDTPRVRYLGELKTSRDVRPVRGVSQILHEIVHGPSSPTELATPHAVAVHPGDGRVAVADTNGACVHIFHLAGRSYVKKTVCDDSGAALECPVAVAWTDEALWVADAQLPAVVRFEPQGICQVIGRAVLRRPAGMAICPTNDLCYVSDAGAHKVFVFDRSGQLVFQFGSQGGRPGQFNFPSQLSFGDDGSLAVVDSLNFRIQRFTPDGTLLGSFGRKGDAAGDFALPKGIATDPDGNLWIVDAQFENIQAFTPEGQLLLAFGGEGQNPGEFWLPGGLWIDENRRMWVADTYNRRVQVFELLK